MLASAEGQVSYGLNRTEEEATQRGQVESSQPVQYDGRQEPVQRGCGWYGEQGTAQELGLEQMKRSKARARCASAVQFIWHEQDK